MQARRYVARLREACERAADGTAASRSVREVLAPRAPADLQFVKAGAHLVLFRERCGEVEITDVLHGGDGRGGADDGVGGVVPPARGRVHSPAAVDGG